jgi:hypothetical protein
VIVSLSLLCTPLAVFADGALVSLLEKKGPALQEIITNRTIFRELELLRLPISSRQAEFLIDHPRISVSLAHHYAPFLDRYSVEIRPDRMIDIRDPGGGLAGEAELIEARPGRRVYLIDGYFNVFSVRFNGRMVLMTVYSERNGREGVTVDSTTSAYIKVDSVLAGVLARLMDLLFPRKVDERIVRFLNAAEKIAFAVHADPAEAYRKLSASGEMSPEELENFARIF